MMDSVKTAEDVDEDKVTDGSAPESGNSNLQDAVTHALKNVDWSVVSLSGANSSGSEAAQSGRVKKPMNAFMVWAQEARRNLSREHPQHSATELSKTLGKLWGQLSAKDKRSFIDEARRIRSQFHIDHPGYKYESKRKARTNQSSAEASGPVVKKRPARWRQANLQPKPLLPERLNAIPLPLIDNQTSPQKSGFFGKTNLSSFHRPSYFNLFESTQTTQEKKAPQGREFKGRFSQWHSDDKPANRGHTRFVDKWNNDQENVEMDFSNFLRDHSGDNFPSNAGNSESLGNDSESLIAMAFNQVCNSDMDFNQAEFTDDTNIATDWISTQMYMANQNQVHASTANQNLDNNPGSAGVPNPGLSEVANLGSAEVPDPGLSEVANLGSAGVPNPGLSEVANLGSTGVPDPGLSEVANLGSTGVIIPGSTGLTNPVSTGLTNPGSTGMTNPGSFRVANPGGVRVANPGSFGGANPGSFGGANPGSFGGANPGSFGGANPGSFGGANPWSFGGANPGSFGGANPGPFRGANPGSFGANPGSFGGANPGSFGGANPGSFGGANPGSFGGVNLGPVGQSFLIAIQQVLKSCQFQNAKITNQKMTEVLNRTLNMQASFAKLTPVQNLANIGTSKHGANSAIAGNQKGIQIPSYSDFRPGNPVDQGQMNMMGAPNDATQYHVMDLPANIKTAVVAPLAIPKTGSDINNMQMEVEAKNVPESNFKATN